MQNKTMLARLRERTESESGFTLIELLIVITILGILAAIVVFAVGSTGKSAASASCQSDVKTVETAQEANKAQTGSYAATVAALVTAGYMREAPSNSKYTITTAVAGSVTVAAAGGSGITGGTMTVGDTVNTAASICAAP